MNRRGYELYTLEQAEDLSIRAVNLGSSPELVAATYRPKQDAHIEFLPAARALREWLTSHPCAHEGEETRFAVLSRKDTVCYNPFERGDLLPQLAYLDFSDEHAIRACLTAHGTPYIGAIAPSWLFHQLADAAIGRVGNEVDLVPGRSRDPHLFLIPIWELRRQAGMLRLAMELARTVKTRDAVTAQALIGPIASSRGLIAHLGQSRAERSGRDIYRWEGPCWTRGPLALGKGGQREANRTVRSCPLRERCPRPDPREGWGLSMVRHLFGPCGRRRPVTSQEYLVAAHQTVADMLSFNVNLSAQVLVVNAVHDADLRSPVTAEFVPEMHEATKDIDSASGFADRMPDWGRRPQLFEHSAPRARAEVPTRAPLFRFHRQARGSLGAAWYQMLDLLVHFSELRRCKYCGALFGATHGGQKYCTAAKPGQRSACQQAAKKASQRAARKSDRENPKRRRRPRRAASF